MVGMAAVVMWILAAFCGLGESATEMWVLEPMLRPKKLEKVVRRVERPGQRSSL